MFRTEGDILARLDELREQRAEAKRAEAKRAEAAILSDILDVLAIAGAMRVNGEPISRSVLIDPVP